MIRIFPQSLFQPILPICLHFSCWLSDVQFSLTKRFPNQKYWLSLQDSFLSLALVLRKKKGELPSLFSSDDPIQPNLSHCVKVSRKRHDYIGTWLDTLWELLLLCATSVGSPYLIDSIRWCFELSYVSFKMNSNKYSRVRNKHKVWNNSTGGKIRLIQ